MTTSHSLPSEAYLKTWRVAKKKWKAIKKPKVRCGGCGHWTERKMGRGSFSALLNHKDDTVWVCSPTCWEKVFKEKYDA